MKGHVGGVFMYLGVHKGWKNPSQGIWWKNYNQSIVNSEAIGVNTKEAIDVAKHIGQRNANCLQKHCKTRCICGKGALEHNMHEGGISCQICNYPIYYFINGLFQ